MTDYSQLLNEGRLRRIHVSERQVQHCLRIARRDLLTARAVLETSPEWAYNIAYNAMQQAGRALMFRAGFRPVGEGQHLTVIRFLETALGPEHADAIAVMDRMRRTRNRAVYEVVGSISHKQACEATTFAERFVCLIVRTLQPPGEDRRTGP